VAALPLKRPQDLYIYRPYDEELPRDLLAAAGVDERALAAVLALRLVRVAKLDGVAVGAYGIRPLSSTSYELVLLVVAEDYRRHGFGRWLLGHAIGLAEAKGARQILVRGQRQAHFLRRAGFEPVGDDQQLELIPE